jgi:hypothetical protein
VEFEAGHRGGPGVGWRGLSPTWEAKDRSWTLTSLRHSSTVPPIELGPLGDPAFPLDSVLADSVLVLVDWNRRGWLG